MGEMKIKVENNTEEMFRRIAMRKFGYKKGAISMAANEAMQNWASSYPDENKIENPVNAIVGLMKHVKKTSVELHHEAGNILMHKYANRHKHFS